MIGDKVFDVTMAVNANVAPIGMDWGYHEVDELRSAGADTILSTFHDLEALLRKMWGEV